MSGGRVRKWKGAMGRIESHIRTDDSGFLENQRHHLALRGKLAEAHRSVEKGGGADIWKRLASRGKMKPRLRVKKLIDPKSPFLELSPLAGFDMYDGACPAGGVVTGIGLVSGRACMIVANDPSVKGGSYFPVTVKKHLRAQEIAMQNRLPCLYLADSGGAYLPLQAEVFPDRDHFGRIFYNMAQMSAEGIPQLAAVLGLCTAGGAYVPAMADEVVMVEGNGSIFLGGPPLVRAATGEKVTAEELGGARVHCSISGVADDMCPDEASALERLRELVGRLPVRQPAVPAAPAVEPLYDPEEIFGILPADPRQRYDVHEVLARVLDGSDLTEFKPHYGPTLVCGFANIMGFAVGVVANNGPLTCEAAQKGAHFVQMADQRGVPLVFFQDITGFMVGTEHEHRGIAKEGAKMVRAVANCSVPKLTIVIGGSHGAGTYAMAGRAYSPRFLWSWPSARISVMSGEAAASVLVQVRKAKMESAGQEASSEELSALEEDVRRRYAAESSAFYGTARLWDDGIIDPVQTRNILGLALGVASLDLRPGGRYGIFRM